MNTRIRRIVRTVANTQLRVLGIDPSLTSTGYAYRDASGAVVSGTIETGKLTDAWRLYYIRQQALQLIARAQPQLVVYEDYAMGKVGKGGSRAFHIGELGGVLKTLFWENRIDVMLVAPTALKKAITGRGNADSKKRVGTDKSKPEMRAALLNTFKLDLNQNDEADACGLMLMGEMRFGSHTVAKAVQSKLFLGTIKDCAIMKGRGNDLKSIASKH